ncbi:MAG: hypothetical protein Q4A70_03760 [Candidatus Saccharibacteria bacterium]|nr:hypothetical protein [Candidatus Saccharibacteria bacterium]
MREAIKKQSKKGFTLVELSLSIAFIAILSIIIVVIINNTISSYRRGMTLNKINSTGMDLVDDIRAAIQNSPGAAVTGFCDNYKDGSDERKRCLEDGALNYVLITKRADVVINGKAKDNVPVFGAFCPGSYSYIWNSGYFANDGQVKGVWRAELKYKIDGSVKTRQNFWLLKLEDRDRSVCASVMKGANPNNNSNAKYEIDNSDIANVFDISNYQSLFEEPIDVLSTDAENNLVLYDLWSAKPAESKSKKGLFYVASLILGTLQGGVDITAKGNFCATPGGYQAAEDLDYCAINKFNIASQAMGE